STREPASLRDGLIPLGITTMSAGSHTEPGGYTGAGQDNLHQTVRGRIQNENLPFEGTHQEKRKATGQFDIADDRSPSEMADVILKRGYEPVWKDWDASILSPS
ncbi:MAG TPA: 2-iminoacetate synthase ThiH, partial [Verrucomicrobiales bacterium]|nr:2-iminoacetate synthase ThiH [Verrucomicrobiales bacterium]